MFNAHTRLADMITCNPTLVLLMPRLGISFGFGDKTVAEVCKTYGLPLDFVLLVCNLYTTGEPLPDEQGIASLDMRLLVPYLQASHRYYTEERLPHLQRHLAAVGERAGERCGAVLDRFFEGYKQDIADHFALEEQKIFPYLQSLEKGGSAKPSLSRHFSHNHTDLREKISDLLQILYKYIPSDAPVEELNELIFGLLQLSSDFERHALIEDHVMLPYIAYLERRQS